MTKLTDWLEKVKEECKKATPGPWKWVKPADNRFELHGNIKYEDMCPILVLVERCKACNERGAPCLDPSASDRDLIVHSRTTVEVLVKMVRLLDQRVDHEMTCDVVLSGKCDCGYAELQEKLEALVPEGK